MTHSQDEASARQGEWRPATDAPQTEVGTDRYFIVAVRRAHSGRVYSFPATYLNDYALEYQDEPYDRNVTGWFSAEGGSDDGYTYQDLLGKGDELVAWRTVPQFDPASPPSSVAAAKQGASVLSAPSGEGD